MLQEALMEYAHAARDLIEVLANVIGEIDDNEMRKMNEDEEKTKERYQKALTRLNRAIEIENKINAGRKTQHSTPRKPAPKRKEGKILQFKTTDNRR